jgi:hypothetical protein
LEQVVSSLTFYQTGHFHSVSTLCCSIDHYLLAQQLNGFDVQFAEAKNGGQKIGGQKN